MMNLKSISASQLEVTAANLGTSLYKNRSMQDFYRSKATLSNSESDTILWEGESEIQTKFNGLLQELQQKSAATWALRNQVREDLTTARLKTHDLELKKETLEAMNSYLEKAVSSTRFALKHFESRN